MRQFASFRSTAEIDVWIDDMTNSMVLQMSGDILAMTKEKIMINKSWPRDWWQAVKLRFLPAWLERRFPVVYDSVHVDQLIYGGICPHISLSGDKRPHLHYLMECSNEHKEARAPAQPQSLQPTGRCPEYRHDGFEGEIPWDEYFSSDGPRFIAWSPKVP